MVEEHFDFLVIGKGLFGSAAARHLSEYTLSNSGSVAVIGPDEPEDPFQHEGVFASHYDSGRITRILDGDRSCFWAEIARRSIARYRDIEKLSGIEFFNPVGCLKVAPDDKSGREYIANHDYVGKKLDVNLKYMSLEEIISEFPFLDFPASSIAMIEGGSAGWIDPRKLIKAQLKIASDNGAVNVRDTVIDVNLESGDKLRIQTESGKSFLAGKVLVAAGAFSNFNRLYRSPLPISARGEAVLKAEVAEEEMLIKLKSMPSIIWPVCREDIIDGVYIVPPAEYPDGKFYIKIGARSIRPMPINTIDDAIRWFHSRGFEEVTREYKRVLEELLPGVKFKTFETRPCVITDSDSGYPYIGEWERNVHVLVGGNGYGAKSSDELGKLGAQSLLSDKVDTIVRKHTSLFPVKGK